MTIVFKGDPATDFAAFSRSVFRGTGARYAYRLSRGTCEFLLYSAVSIEGVNAATFCPILDSLDGERIVVRLSCPGGDALDALAIHNHLRAYHQKHGAPVTVFVDGVALSAGSILAMAGSEIVISPGARMMVHDIEGFAFGRAGRLRDIADQWDALNNTGAEIYADRTGLSTSKTLEMMAATTWLDAGQAVALGFADRLAKDEEQPPHDLPTFNLSRYQLAG